jgi:LytS/YehU family sensor histidine kinase
MPEKGYVYYAYLPGLLFWLLLTYPIYILFSWSQKFKVLPRIGFLILVSIFFGSIKNILSATSYYVITNNSTAKFNETYFKFQAYSTYYYYEAIMMVFVVIILLFMLEFNQKFKEKSIETLALESQLNQSKLNSLKMQLHPHFLFNTHNTIAMLIRNKKEKKAIEMITSLSDLLRISLSEEIKQMISLKKEIELIKKYLAIEEIRFEDNLEILFDIAKNTEEINIPSLILQPIVENAFKHGIAEDLKKSELKISSFIKNKYLILQVYNSGKQLDKNFKLKKQNGIGLSNTLKRLKRIYNSKAKFELKNDNNGVVVILKIPINE